MRYNLIYNKGEYLSKIVLEVEDKNIDTVLLILHNLKQGLITNINTDKKNTNTTIQAKKALRKKVIEDEFMSESPSSGKYLSKSAYKNKVRKG
jgi:hypothetical protein